jgi:DNA polymerase I
MPRFLVTDIFPEIPDTIHTLYLDVETVSGTITRGATLPYMGDRVCGIAFTYDKCPDAWYIPVRHKPNDELFGKSTPNLDIDRTLEFIQSLIDRSKQWVNHNIKFDAHFLYVEGVNINTKLVDTLTLAKLVDMQSKNYGYGLKPLAKAWCGMEADEQGVVKTELKKRKTKDYGDVPADIMGKYACTDVLMNRELWKEIVKRKYEDIDKVWELEIELTRTLFNIETRGLIVDTEAMAMARESSQTQLAKIESELNNLGYGEVNPSSPSALAKFVTSVLKLPVISVTEKGSVSMNSEAVHGYMELENVVADKKLSRFFYLIDKYRERSQFVSLYAEGWLSYIDENERMHPMYRQTVATGRMACAQPNMQQLNKEAKGFVVPAVGNSFLSLDYSQIEYRVIASLTRDENIFSVYEEDPSTDFHSYIAELCGIDRKPAKTVNFGIAFGMGERSLISSLAESLGREEAEQESANILSTYHKKFPKIKQVATLATQRARSRGWIRTLAGRRRALDPEFTHKAFNTAVQGTAADIAKERLIAVDKDELLRNAGVTVRAVVHDEFLLEGPTDAIESQDIREHIENIMVSTTIDLGIPLLVDGGISKVAWSQI